LEHSRLENREGGGIITLRRILGKWVLKKGGGRAHFRFLVRKCVSMLVDSTVVSTNRELELYEISGSHGGEFNDLQVVASCSLVEVHGR
jgi:hypothetical protein